MRFRIIPEILKVKREIKKTLILDFSWNNLIEWCLILKLIPVYQNLISRRRVINADAPLPHTSRMNHSGWSRRLVCTSKPAGTVRNGPEGTYKNTETDFYEYRNGPERTSLGTETDRNRSSAYRNKLQWEPEMVGWGTVNLAPRPFLFCFFLSWFSF